MKRISALVLLAILASSLGIGVYIWTLNTQPHFQLTPTPAHTPAMGGYKLINGNISVDGIYYIKFDVPSSAFDINVSGNFSVLNNGTIRVVIVNSTNFVSGLGKATSYDSGQQVSGSFSIPLAQNATYYLVYDNFIEWGNFQPLRIIATDVDFSYYVT
jgi:hypothetical protein